MASHSTLPISNDDGNCSNPEASEPARSGDRPELRCYGRGRAQQALLQEPIWDATGTLEVRQATFEISIDAFHQWPNERQIQQCATVSQAVIESRWPCLWLGLQVEIAQVPATVAVKVRAMMNILITDDSKAILRVLTLGMERAGYEVTTACDGSDALQKILERQPDFLVTDIEMPHMTGKQLCLAIEKNIPDRAFPIVIMTASTDAHHREWAANLRNTTFIEKPVSVRSLVVHVNRCLDGPGSVSVSDAQ